MSVRARVAVGGVRPHRGGVRVQEGRGVRSVDRAEEQIEDARVTHPPLHLLSGGEGGRGSQAGRGGGGGQRLMRGLSALRGVGAA